MSLLQLTLNNLGRIFGFGRVCHAQQYTLNSTIATTPAINISDFAGFGLRAMNSLDDLIIHVSESEIGPWAVLLVAGSQTSIVLGADQALTLPVELHPWSWMKLVPSADNIDVMISSKS